MDNKEGEVKCLMNLGLMYWSSDEFEESSKKYKKALSLAKKIYLIDEQKKCTSALKIYRLHEEGRNLRNFSREHQKSIESFQKAINLARRIGSKEHEARCLRQLSIT